MTMPPPYDPPPPYAAPPPLAGPQPATGKALLSVSWSMLRQDRELLWLPVLGSLAGLVAAGILFVPGWFIGAAAGGTNHHSWAGTLGGVLAAAAATTAAVYFQAALVIGADQRAEGGDPTLGGCLHAAWAMRGRILTWGLLSATVGVAIRALEQRLGFLGRLLGFLGGLAWAIASFLVVPVLVAEQLGPMAAVKRSAHLIKSVWGTGLRTTLRFGFIQFVVTLVPMIVGVVAVVGIAASGSTAATVIWGLILIAAVLAFLVAAIVFSAIGSYARALIYRYASGRPVPGIDPALFAGVFQPRMRKGRRIA